MLCVRFFSLASRFPRPRRSSGFSDLRLNCRSFRFERTQVSATARPQNRRRVSSRRSHESGAEPSRLPPNKKLQGKSRWSRLSHEVSYTGNLKRRCRSGRKKLTDGLNQRHFTALRSPTGPSSFKTKESVVVFSRLFYENAPTSEMLPPLASNVYLPTWTIWLRRVELSFAVLANGMSDGAIVHPNLHTKKAPKAELW